MINQLIIGIVGEGPTDYRFLSSIIRRTFEELAFDCHGNVEILDIQEIFVESGQFPSFLHNAAKKGQDEYGIMILCVHKDADSKDDGHVFQNNINPGIQYINESEEELCKNIVPIVPIVETEAWLLADKNLFKDEIGSDKTDTQLKISGSPELITDPKQRIKEAIQLAYDSYPKRRHRPDISDLYKPIGQKVSIQSLRQLTSFNKFESAARKALVKMNYLRE